MGNRLKSAAGLTLATSLVVLVAWSCRSPAVAEADKPAGEASEADAQIERMWANAACYVCHMTFVHEELSKVHVEAGTTCIDCHGLSAKHANDEDIGATKPDIIYARAEIDAACRKCHEEHDAPARNVIARWLQRRPPSPPVCTDCHGTHRIADAAEEHKTPPPGKPTP